MELTRHMREKYRSKSYGNGLFNRRPPGGEDVIRVCDLADRLEQIVRTMQHQLPTDQQNEIERQLWSA
jgi:hypothetical protein